MNARLSSRQLDVRLSRATPFAQAANPARALIPCRVRSVGATGDTLDGNPGTLAVNAENVSGGTVVFRVKFAQFGDADAIYLATPF